MKLTSTLTFRLEPLPDIQVLGPIWRGLEARAENAFFLSWHWIGAWLSEIDGTPMLLSGRVGSDVVLLGLLTTFQRRDLGLLPVSAAILHETGDPATDVITIEYNGFLVAREWHGRAEAAAAQFLLKGVPRGSIHELHLKGAPASYEPFLVQHGIASVPSRKPSWRVDLEAVRRSGVAYLNQVSSNTRQQVRRSIRLYEGRGELRLTRARDVDEGFEYLAGLQSLHQRYWESRGEKGSFFYPFFGEFHRRVIAEGIPANCVELVKVTCADEAIGYLYNFLYRGHVLSYQSGFLYEPDSKLKPGLVSHCLCIEKHLDLGASVYDFMAGDSQYKASLGQRGPDMLNFLVQNPTAPIRIANSFRGLAKTVARSRPRALGALAAARRAAGL